MVGIQKEVRNMLLEPGEGKSLLHNDRNLPKLSPAVMCKEEIVSDELQILQLRFPGKV